MLIKTWSGSIIETREYGLLVWPRWARGWIVHLASKWTLTLRVRIARAIAPQPKKLFIVVKFGGKTYLRATEDELRFQVAYSGGVGIKYREKALQVEIYECDSLAGLAAMAEK